MSKLRSRKKAIVGWAFFTLIAIAIIFLLFVAGWVGKTIGQAKQYANLKGVVEVYMNLDDKGTEFIFLEAENDERNFMEILGILGSGMKVEGDFVNQLRLMEDTFKKIKNSDKKNYYIAVMNSSGDVIYEKKTGNPPLFWGTGLEEIELDWPVEPKNDRITSGFGWRKHPVTGEEHSFHGGIDIEGGIGEPVFYSIKTEGEVIRVEFDKYLGNFVVVEYVSPRTNVAYQIYYGHLDRAYVRVGDKVKKGDKIGGVGDTGRVTESHLHLEVRMDKNGDNYYEPKEEAINLCPYLDVSTADNPKSCTQRCAVYENPSMCDIAEVVKNRFDLPLLGGEKGSAELVLW
jgi:hypothetical protein